MKITVNELIYKLKNSPLDKFPSVLANIHLEATGLEKFETWDEQAYTRNYIFRDERFEVLLICWSAKQVSAIHDHGGAKCWVYQIDGINKETRYELNSSNELKELQAVISKPGDLTFMEDSIGYHRFENTQDNTSRTLHIYANPIDKCQIYNEDTLGFETLNVDCDYQNTASNFS